MYINLYIQIRAPIICISSFKVLSTKISDYGKRVTSSHYHIFEIHENMFNYV